MEWKHPTSPWSVRKKFKTEPSAVKVMLALFWDAQWPILEHYQERRTTANSVRYSAMLQEQLKPAIPTKYRGLLLKGVAMLDDNVRPPTPFKASAN
jgi:hypothetical protein